MLVRLGVDAFTSFSNVPLYAASYLGLAFTLAGTLLLAVGGAQRLLGGGQWFAGAAVTVATGLLLGGVQMLCLGVLGEYLGRMYDEIKGRPLYLVERRWGR